MSLSLDNKIDRLLADGFEYFQAEKIYKRDELCLSMDSLCRMNDETFESFILSELPEFENIEEIERHPIDIELQKCEAIIKQACIDMLHLVGIDISEITLDVSNSGNSWFIAYDGLDLFECHIGELIRSFQKRENENAD